MLDTIVDGHLPMVDRLADVTDDLEDQAVGKPDRDVAEEPFSVRGSLLLFFREGGGFWFLTAALI